MDLILNVLTSNVERVKKLLQEDLLLLKFFFLATAKYSDDY